VIETIIERRRRMEMETYDCFLTADEEELIRLRDALEYSRNAVRIWQVVSVLQAASLLLLLTLHA
jgi:hypothetical protein